MNWADTRRFDPKLQTILDSIDTLTSEGYTVSLVAVSAGASAALNAYARRPDKVNTVTLICGQILGGRVHVHQKVFAKNTAFGGSIEMLDTTLPKLDHTLRKRIISIHPVYDPWVPVSDTKLPGAKWRKIPTSGHFTSIAFAITLGSRRIVKDIKKAYRG